MKKLFSFLFLLILSLLLQVSVHAETITGTCGESLTWSLQDGQLIISGTGEMINYTESDKAPWYSQRLNIKSLIISDGVSSLGDYAFLSCNKITSVHISDTVTLIGKNCFQACKQLTEVTLPVNIDTICNSAFFNCTKLEKIYWNSKNVQTYSGAFSWVGKDADMLEVVFGESVTHIPNYAFGNVESLSCVTIPKSVTHIGDQAFYQCENLKQVYWNAISVDDFSYGGWAFYKSGSETGMNVIFGNEVEKIPSYAFRLCTNLTEVTIPENVVSVGQGAFRECENLEKVFWNATQLIDYTELTESRYIFYKSGAIDNGFNIKIGSNVKKIPTFFAESSRVSEVNIPANVDFIGDYAFDDCVYLKKVFYDAVSVAEFDTINHFVFSNIGAETTGTEFVFGDSVENIPAYLLNNYYSPNVTSIDVGQNVKLIGKKAFGECRNLKKVVWRAKETNDFHDGYSSIAIFPTYQNVTSAQIDLLFTESVKKIPAGIMKGCDNLKTVTIPDGVAQIGQNAFNNCNNLNIIYWNLKEFVSSYNNNYFLSAGENNNQLKIVFGEGVEVVPDYLFEGTYVNEIVFNDVTQIGNSSFANSENLTSLVIPEGVTYIGEYAFSNCNNLKSITVPSSLTEIGISAFDSCFYLETLKWNAVSVTGFEPNDDFDPDNLVFEYAGTEGKGINVIFGNSVEEVPDYMFKPYVDMDTWYQSAPKISKISLGESVTKIGNNAFAFVNGLKDVKIPLSVTSIGYSAFEMCDSISTVYYAGSKIDWNRIEIDLGNDYLLNAKFTYFYSDLIKFKVKGYDFTRFGGVWNVANATVTCNGVTKTTDANGEVTFSCEEVGYVDNGDYSFVSYEVECDGYFSKSNSRCYRPNQYIHTVSLLARDASRIYPQNIVLHGAIPNKLGDSRTVYTQDMPYHWTNEIRMDKQLNRSYRMDLTIDWNGYEPGNVYLQNNETGKQLAFINNSLTFNPKFDLDAGSDYSIVAYSSDGTVSAATKIYFSVSGTPSKLTDVDYTINHKGKAFVRINLKNAQGGVPSNKNIQYGFEGYDGVYEGTTDASGTIIVETPVLSGKNETKQLTVTFNDDTLEKSTYVFDVFISDLSYSQSWKGKVGAGVGAELSFGVDGSVGVAEGEAKLASIGVEGKAAKTLCIETEHNNGKQRIKLSTSTDASIAEKLSAGIFAGIGTPTEMAELSVGKVYGEVEAGTGKEIALVIDDFNPNNSEHLKQIAMFLLDCSLSLDKNTTNVILQKLLNHLLNDGNDVYNEQYTNKSAKLGTGAKAGFFEAGDFEVTLLGASGETFYQHKSGTDANDNTVYSTELTADAGVDIGEVKMNETNIGSENLLSFDWLNNSVELKTTIDPSDIVNYGVKDISIKSLIDSDKHSILWGTQKNSTYSTLTFDEEEAKGLTMKVNNLDRFLNNKRWLFSTNEFCQMVNDAVNSGNSADYTKTKTKENGFNASYNFGLTALAGAEVGFTISAIDSTEYVTQNGIMENGVIYKTSESYISDSEAKSGIDTIISLAIDYLSEIAKSYFVDKAGELSEGVDLDKAKVEKVTSSLIDVGTEIIKIKASEISPFSLLSIEEENDSIDSSYRTKTIGESYVVNFKDSNGNYVDELDGVAKLTLSYDLSDLENSGISSEQTDLNSMSIYKWNESKNVYTRIGSTVDIDNCSVSAEISGSGEYVLAIDDEAPTVTDITVLNNSQNPIISAIISDASGLNEFTLQLDDNLVVDENSFYDYYDSKTSLFRYTCSTTLTDGVHVAIFNIVDGTGNKMEPIYYTFTVDTSSPIINSVTIPETSENTTIAIEATVLDENVSRVLAVMEYIDTTYTYEMDNNGGIWTVNVEKLPDFAVLNTYIMAYDSFGNESKSDIYETILAKNSGDEISIGIISVDGKDIVVGINNKLEDTNSCIYVAGYSSQGELEEIKTIDVTEIGVMLKPVKMDELHDTYKVFCWESLNTLKPLSDYSEYFKFYN